LSINEVFVVETLDEFDPRRPERSTLGMHIVDMSRIIFFFATKGLGEETFFKGSLITWQSVL
jgi:hypothetical protein